MPPVQELQNVTKREAEIEEEKWRVNLLANMNMIKAYQTECELKQYMSNHYNENKEKYVEKAKQNREKIS